MFFFYKHTNRDSKVKHSLEQQKLIQSWVNKCVRLQHKASLFLQHKSEKVSISFKRLAIISFCLISFSSCVYTIITSFFGHHKVNLSIASIRVPKRLTQNKNSHITATKGEGKNEFEKIEKFRAYIDSLATTNSGKSKYDSLLRSRLGLLDSLAIIENLYNSQSSNK
jgi:hypothetical protein